MIGDRYEFELKAIGPDVAWVAAGLSSDAKMGDDSVIECVRQGLSVRAFSSRTTARPYSATRLTNVSSIQGLIIVRKGLVRYYLIVLKKTYPLFLLLPLSQSHTSF